MTGGRRDAPSPGFSAGATPFVPSNAGQSASNSGMTGQFKVTAAPFVPGSSAVGSMKAGTATTQQLTSSAAPFVPSTAKPATSFNNHNAGPTGVSPTIPHHKGSHPHAGSPHRGSRAHHHAAAAGMVPGSSGMMSPGASSTVSVGSAGNNSSSSTQQQFGTVLSSASTAPSPTGVGYTPSGHASPVMGRGGPRSGRGDHVVGRGRGRGAVPWVPVTTVDTYVSSTTGMTPSTGHPRAAGHGPGASPLVSPGGPRPHAGWRPGYSKHVPPGRTLVSRQFMEEGLRQQLAAAAYAVQAQWSGMAEAAAHPLPERISSYHTLVPLDHPSTLAAGCPESFSHALGVRTCVLKAISSHDGHPVTLRRIDPKQVIPTADALASAVQAVEAWAPLAQHPNLVALRSAFVSADLDGSSALFFVYDYHPGSVTLAAAHLTPMQGTGGMMPALPPPEPALWSYLVQLTCLLRAVHMSGLPLRPSCLHATKVLLTPAGRLRVNCCGLVDALGSDLAHDRHTDIHHAHRMDLTAVGQLLLSLACAGLVPPGHVGSLELLSNGAGAGRYSHDLMRLLSALLAAAEGGPLGSVRQLAAYPIMVEHSLQELDAAATHADVLTRELGKECENGRLLRLLVKLNFVCERPEGDVDGSWAETGDRYLLKLFRDFVFHQRVPEGSPAAGAPLMDWGYVIEALNKLDAGVPERIMLLSRDEAAMLVASYADLKRCIENSYADLQARAATMQAKSSTN